MQKIFSRPFLTFCVLSSHAFFWLRKTRFLLKRKFIQPLSWNIFPFEVKCNIKVDRFMCSVSGMLLLKLKNAHLEMAATTSIFDPNIPVFYSRYIAIKKTKIAWNICIQTSKRHISLIYVFSNQFNYHIVLFSKSSSQYHVQ